VVYRRGWFMWCTEGDGSCGVLSLEGDGSCGVLLSRLTVCSLCVCVYCKQLAA